MPAKTPWMTSRDLIESVKRKISAPISQVTFTDLNILSFANEELMIGQVPAILTYHQEYFVTTESTPLLPNTSRYPVPQRAIGLKLRDVGWKDQSGVMHEMTRIDLGDEAFFSGNSVTNAEVHKFFIRGNDIVLTPQIFGTPYGTLDFSFYLRPNQLVPNNRACICQSFTRKITINNANFLPSGNQINLGSDLYNAVTSSPNSTDFLIGAASSDTALNFASLINTNQPGYTALAVGSDVLITYLDLTMLFTTLVTSAVVISDNVTITFDQVPTTWQNPDTFITESLFIPGEYVDFLQTKPGHKMRKYDIQIPLGGISGSSITFPLSVLPLDFIPCDYVCLANECIIPQIPTDLHNGLAERTCARLLAALGDKDGLEITNSKIGEIIDSEGKMMADRVEGAPQKILGKHSLLRWQRMYGWRKF